MKSVNPLLFSSSVLPCLVFCLAGSQAYSQNLEKPSGSIRIATYNVALNRDAKDKLRGELIKGDSKQAKAVAKVIQRVRPEILLINELDFDADGKSAESFIKTYLGESQNDAESIDYPYHFIAPVNTGVDSGLDLNGDHQTGTPDDAFGFGKFPGQYGMLVLSKFEIDKSKVRTFQKFLWKDMPGALWPLDPNTKKSYYSDEVKDKFRLSSKSHWDVPIKIGDTTIHFLVCHPTPPVFDGAEDKNGMRNHDEIRIWSDYVSGKADYLYDDQGNKGGLPDGSNFVIAGDLNADPVDGDSRDRAINQLLDCQCVTSVAPKSTGGAYWAREQGGANKQHKGDPSCDTGDFSDRSVGNMRIDYVLPSKTLKVIGSGVFWPKPDEPGAQAAQQSDHRLVWIDVEK